MRRIGVVGLGYVGLPLAIELAKKTSVIGFDINESRIQELKRGYDRTKEVDEGSLTSSSIQLTHRPEDLASVDFFIVTVPTPINMAKQPDLTAIIGATETVARQLKKGDIVVYESTVFPGCTEEKCVPILEKISGLKYNVDFYCGYSPERINPGDKEKTITKIKKVVSASTPAALEIVNSVYSSVIEAGTYQTSSIKVAEAAKVIENTQRDINIAFMNELSLIFERMGLDTNEVLDAASTKWNFLRFTPGLVGGHCIGVDPYYLTHKAKILGYHPQVILSGRQINDEMGHHVANQVVKKMISKNINIRGSKVLILGVTFKENCPDVRNSRVIDVIHELQDFGCDVQLYDPHAIADEVAHEYDMQMQTSECLENLSSYDAIIVAVSHKDFLKLDWSKINRNTQVVFDVKALLPKEMVDGRL